MNGLLEVATVLEGDGHWTIGYEIDALACGRVIEAYDICTPGTPAVSDSAVGFKVDPFALVGAQKFGTRCEPSDAADALTRALADSTEKLVANNFWNGDVTDWVGNPGDMYLTSPSIFTVSAGSDTLASIAAALIAASDNHPEIDPILHLGVGAALSIPNWETFEALGIEYSISLGYPSDGIAVTGPVLVRLGSIETLERHDERNNRNFVSATRLAAVEFDPCLAVVVS